MPYKTPSTPKAIDAGPSFDPQILRAARDLERDGNLEPLRSLIGGTRRLVFNNYSGTPRVVTDLKFNGSERAIMVETERGLSSTFDISDLPFLLTIRGTDPD